MEKQVLTEKQIIWRTHLFWAPLVILSVLTCLFTWAGGGKGIPPKLTAEGINMTNQHIVQFTDIYAKRIEVNTSSGRIFLVGATAALAGPSPITSSVHGRSSSRPPSPREYCG